MFKYVFLWLFLAESCNNSRGSIGSLVLVLVDFEKSSLNGISNIRTQIEIKGCFYHLCSNIWKHIQILGLQVQYNTDHDFALHLRMVCALVFVPPNDVINSFVALCQEIRNNFNDDADDLLEYFEDTYIGRFVKMPLDETPYLTSICGICSTELIKNYQEQTAVLKDGIEDFRGIFQHAIQTSGNSSTY